MLHDIAKRMGTKHASSEPQVYHAALICIIGHFHSPLTSCRSEPTLLASAHCTAITGVPHVTRRVGEEAPAKRVYGRKRVGRIVLRAAFIFCPFGRATTGWLEEAHPSANECSRVCDRPDGTPEIARGIRRARALYWRSDEPSTQAASPAVIDGGVRGDGETKSELKLGGDRNAFHSSRLTSRWIS